MKIAIISAVDFDPWQFRSEFIATLIYNGHEVTVISSKGPYVERLQAIGAKHIVIHLNRFISPLTDLLYLFRLYFTLRQLKPDIVYAMTTKPVYFGTVIAKLTSCPNVYSIFGGIGFCNTSGGGFISRSIKLLGQIILRIGTKFTDGFIFQNDEDLDIFIKKNIVTKEKSIVVNGSGVNLYEFSSDFIPQKDVENIRKEFGVSDYGILVVMISRITKNKGILEFIESSQMFSDMIGQIRFIHVGSRENGSLENVTEEQLKETSLFKQVGFRTDIREIIAASDIVVLPSYHREGVPNTLLEGLAMKKPIVTTDNVGCREVVEDGVNGFLVPIQNANALAIAIRKLVNDPELRIKMGKAGYEKAKQKFDVKSVNKSILEDMFKLKNVKIPEFYTIENNNGKLVIVLDGEKKIVDVPIVSNNHSLNG
jgi:N,N'-diacetylbacillosaminyl-diphospho-undecaprenol alpha-1,3-N-acetylgalactosaminyltransferase